jgi:hypothetical protein
MIILAFIIFGALYLRAVAFSPVEVHLIQWKLVAKHTIQVKATTHTYSQVLLWEPSYLAPITLLMDSS